MQEIDSTEFAQRTAQGVVIIEFGAEWCKPCKVMQPILDKLAGDYQGKLAVYSVDLERSQDLATQLGVMTVPTMFLYRGGAQVDRMVGVVSERDLRKKIDAAGAA